MAGGICIRYSNLGSHCYSESPGETSAPAAGLDHAMAEYQEDDPDDPLMAARAGYVVTGVIWTTFTFQFRIPGHAPVSALTKLTGSANLTWPCRGIGSLRVLYPEMVRF